MWPCNSELSQYFWEPPVGMPLFYSSHLKHSVRPRSQVGPHGYRQRFLLEFLEVGGALTVLQLITLGISEPERQAAVELLLLIANAGRQFKEHLIESDSM